VSERFDEEWLALREPWDARSRSGELTRAIARALEGDRPLRAVDVACGTGANVRYLADRLSRPQDWLVLDHDPALIGRLPTSMARWAAARGDAFHSTVDGVEIGEPGLACRLTPRLVDLVESDLGMYFDGYRLVTASALIDLVSETWLRRFVRACGSRRCSLLIVLTYDGRIAIDPGDPDDGFVRALVNRHQRTDKGFGPALGPAAADCLETCLIEEAYDVTRALSDWVLAPEAVGIQRRLIEGWARAAVQIAPDLADFLVGWRERRMAQVARRMLTLVVGHTDVCASPIR
jgi:hypothetical protein